MASVTAQQVGIGRLGELVRSVLARLTPLETTSKIHATELDRLKDQAQNVRSAVETLKAISDTQDSETADHDRRIAELTKTLELLSANVAAHEDKIKTISKSLRGEQIKRGRANARAERAEQALARNKRKA
jgi:chromosome segregation ATPase